MSDEQVEAVALLPCPFCGSRAEYANNPMTGRNTMALCVSCGAEAFWRKWNTRAALPSTGFRAGVEAAAKVAESHAAPKGVPQIDYDQACHDIATAIRTERCSVRIGRRGVMRQEHCDWDGASSSDAGDNAGADRFGALCAAECKSSEGYLNNDELAGAEMLLAKLARMAGSEKAEAEYLGVPIAAVRRSLFALKRLVGIERKQRENGDDPMLAMHLTAAFWTDYMPKAEAAWSVIVERPESAALQSPNPALSRIGETALLLVWGREGELPSRAGRHRGSRLDQRPVQAHPTGPCRSRDGARRINARRALVIRGPPLPALGREHHNRKNDMSRQTSTKETASGGRVFQKSAGVEYRESLRTRVRKDAERRLAVVKKSSRGCRALRHC